MMGWLSIKRNGYRSPLVELAITSSIKDSTKRGIIVLAWAASPNTLEAFTYFMNDDARCDSKPARLRCRVLFIKEKMRHD
jgi:hypothetical protein